MNMLPGLCLPVALLACIGTPDTTHVDSISILISAAVAQINVTNKYDPSYVKLDYPNGDVPVDRGVCTDVLIRAFRKLDIDLQVLVHEDMKSNFSEYPDTWGLQKPDRNIDHRRVPNLMRFFERHGKTVSTTAHPAAYRPGDIVAWTLPGNLPHIGIVSDRKVAGEKRYAIIHNIGSGVQLEDVLFEFEIIGHYRFFQ